MNESSTKLGSSLLIAVFVNVLLFLLMQFMIKQGNVGAINTTDLLRIDYVRNRETLIEQQHERRQPPPKPEAPKPPKVERLATQAASTMQPMPMPSMKLSPALTPGPYLGELGGPQWISAGELVALVRIPPEYPAHARMRRIEGFVDVEFVVDTEGRVRNASVVSANPPGVFDRAALNCVIHWKFEPKKQDGRPVEVIARQRIEFELSG